MAMPVSIPSDAGPAETFQELLFGASAFHDTSISMFLGVKFLSLSMGNNGNTYGIPMVVTSISDHKLGYNMI